MLPFNQFIRGHTLASPRVNVKPNASDAQDPIIAHYAGKSAEKKENEGLRSRDLHDTERRVRLTRGRQPNSRLSVGQNQYVAATGNFPSPFSFHPRPTILFHLHPRFGLYPLLLPRTLFRSVPLFFSRSSGEQTRAPRALVDPHSRPFAPPSHLPHRNVDVLPRG